MQLYILLLVSNTMLRADEVTVQSKHERLMRICFGARVLQLF